MIYTAALIACTILALLAIFQLALIFGAPIGRYAWGGAHKVLPMKFRIGSVISIVLYGLFVIIILDSAGIITLLNNQTIENVAIWVLAAYFSLGIFMNAISRSKPERNLMTPVALMLAILVIIVALG